MSVDSRLVPTVRRIVDWLVAGDYDRAASFCNNVRQSRSLIRAAIESYGRKLITPPAHLYESLDVIEVVGAIPRRWSVRLDLWTAEDGRSDLTLELTLVDKDAQQKFLGAEIDNIHTL